MEVSVRMHVAMEEAIIDRFAGSFGFCQFEELADALAAFAMDRVKDDGDLKIQAYFIKRTEEALEEMKSVQKRAVANHKKLRQIEKRRKLIEEDDDDEDDQE